MSVPSAYVSWAVSRVPGKEHVFFANFVRRFDLSDEESATRDFVALLESPNIRNHRREKLKKAFKDFQDHRQKRFWAERTLQVNTEVTVRRAGVIVQDAGVMQAKMACEQFFSSAGGDSLDYQELLDDSEDESGAEDKSPKNYTPEIETDTLDDDADVFRDLEPQLARAKATPFHGLVQYVFNKAQGKPAQLPEVPETFASPNFKEIFVYVRNELLKASLPDFKNARRNTKDFVVGKDVLVALSGIVNTLSPTAVQTFTIAPRIKSESVLPTLTERQPAITALMEDLLGALCPGIDTDPYTEPSLWGLQKRVWELLGDIGKTREPETKDERVSGELTSPAARNARRLVEEAFGATTKHVGGRKVDLSVRIYSDFSWEKEISIYEFKARTVTDDSCEQQQRKAVRLNAAILLELEEQGVDVTKVFPVIAEGRGLSIDLYTLRRYGDVLGAGRAVPQSIWLPAHTSQFKQFLRSESLHVLLAFVEHTRRFAVEVADVLNANPRHPLPTTPPQKHVELAPYVLLTPSKKNKRTRLDEGDDE
ncbi:hypothetical protein BG011_001088 [Mortierella polycephala]|uniref:Uncharacterized protein n=1 Tax=Mortierella polycephala TaxID=41804 RepID=A0A9P6PKJ4_9FUNG|nr:hypothetical protein BG011_001088 [Mortierella polycephala]